MTAPPRPPRSRLRTALWVGSAVLLAAVLFAPVTSTGYCAVAPRSGAAYCDSLSRSIVGVDTGLWIWLGATVVLGALAWWIARRPRRHR